MAEQVLLFFVSGTTYEPGASGIPFGEIKRCGGYGFMLFFRHRIAHRIFPTSHIWRVFHGGMLALFAQNKTFHITQMRHYLG